MGNSNHISPLLLPPIFDTSNQIHSRRPAQKQTFILYQIVTHMQYFLICHLISIIDQCLVEIRSRSVQTYSLDHCIERIAKTVSLFLLVGKQYIVFDLIEQPWTFRISQYHLYLTISLFEILRYASQGPSRSSTATKTIYHFLCLPVYLWPGGLVMHFFVL